MVLKALSIHLGLGDLLLLFAIYHTFHLRD